MSRSDFVPIHISPNDTYYKISKGIKIGTRQVGSKKTAQADVGYYLEVFTQDRVWTPVTMFTGDSQHLIDHINQAHKVTSVSADSSIVDQINGSVNDLEEKLKEIIGDLDKVDQDEETPAWKDQYEDLKKQIEELKKDTKDLKNITPETVQEHEDKTDSEDKNKKTKNK